MPHALLHLGMWTAKQATLLLLSVIALASGCGKQGDVHAYGELPLDSSLSGVNSNPSSPNFGTAGGSSQSPPLGNNDPIQHIDLQPVIPVNVSKPVQITKGDAPLIVKVKDFILNINTNTITLVMSLDGEKETTLTGPVDKELKQAHLISQDRNVEAFAVCKTDECRNFIVTVYKNRDGVPVHAQFKTKGNEAVEEEQSDTQPQPGPSVAASTETDGTDVDTDDFEGADTESQPGEYVAPPPTFATGKGKPSLGADPIFPGMAVGTHSCLEGGGCGHLLNGQQIPVSGPGFQRKLKTTGLWATGYLINFIAGKLKELSLMYSTSPILLVGDSSLQGGGHFPGHVMHTNGLDVDICYPTYTANTGHCLVAYDRKSHQQNAGLDVPRFWALLKSMASTGKVSRIFVHPQIKQFMCNYSKKLSEKNSSDPSSASFKALHALRPNDCHYDHFHVSLNCASYMYHCQDSQPPPGGNGCSEDLEDKHDESNCDLLPHHPSK